MAMASSAIGGMVAALVRFMVGSADPVTFSVFRFGSGFVLVPVTPMMSGPWPKGRYWAGVVGLGILFFGRFRTVQLSFTTAARGALATSTQPLLTMVAGTVLGIERLTPRKSLAVWSSR